MVVLYFYRNFKKKEKGLDVKNDKRSFREYGMGSIVKECYFILKDFKNGLIDFFFWVFLSYLVEFVLLKVEIIKINVFFGCFLG